MHDYTNRSGISAVISFGAILHLCFTDINAEPVLMLYWPPETKCPAGQWSCMSI